MTRAAEAIQGYWSTVGIDCRLQQMENGGFMDAWANGSLQVLINGWFADYPDGNGLLSYFETDNSKTHSCFYSNEEFDELMASARRESDVSAQADLYHQADDIASRRDYAMIPLLYPPPTTTPPNPTCWVTRSATRAFIWLASTWTPPMPAMRDRGLASGDKYGRCS